MKRSLALLTLLLAGAAIPAFPAGKVADDFAAPDSGDLWEVNLGYNLKNTIVPGAEGPRKMKCTVFKIEHKDSSKSSDGNGRWFTAIRLLNVNREDWKKAVGFSIMLATDNPNAWYFSMGLSEEDGTVFSLPAKPSKLFKKYVYYFKDLKTKDPKRKIKPENVNALKLGSATFPATLYIGPLELIMPDAPAESAK